MDKKSEQNRENNQSPDNTNMPPRVLVVDDMPINCMILSSMLHSHGITSDMAGSGEECIELCKKKHYDLILMDHRMPGIDGVDTFAIISDMFRAEGREVPVICHTTDAGRGNINLYKMAGFADVLIKPVDPREFSRVISKYLPIGEQEKEIEEKEQQHLTSEIERLPGDIRNIEKLDVTTGLASSETAEAYMKVLRIFASSIESKASEIESLYDKEDFDRLTLKIHSVKSMSHLAGAVDLTNEAAELEQAGKERDYELLRRRVPGFLSHYREYHVLFSEIESLKTDTGPKSGADAGASDIHKDTKSGNKGGDLR